MTHAPDRVATEVIGDEAPVRASIATHEAEPREGATLLGRYRLEELVGEGGMSLVYAGRHLGLGTPVAIKVLRSKFAGNEQLFERFTREAQLAALVRHPHVVAIRDFGIWNDGQAFTVMEYLRGESLRSTSEREGPLPWTRARHLMLQICSALGAVHGAGIVHRDVTLANVFRLELDGDPDFVKLVDFGMARLTTADAEARRLTSEVEVFGTPAYMAPEQVLRSAEADARSDLYSAGVIFFALLTGRMPFEGRTTTQVLQQQVHRPAPSPRSFVQSIPYAVEAIVLRALDKDPQRRFQTAQELATAIADVDTETSASAAEIEAPPWNPKLVLAFGLGAVLVAFGLAFV